MMNKIQLRQHIRTRKRAMTVEEIEERSARLRQLFLESRRYREARSLYGYLPCNQEVRTLPILQQALRDGKRVALPKCYGSEMKFIWVTDLQLVQKSAFGVPEPIADGPVADDESALVLMPGLAFDHHGHRIGYGGGFYDKFLAREPGHPTLALCYDFQMADHLETEEYDIPADEVLWV